MGVQTSFWIAVALTYLEFLGERDVGSDLSTFAYSTDNFVYLRRVISLPSATEVEKEGLISLEDHTVPQMSVCIIIIECSLFNFIVRFPTG